MEPAEIERMHRLPDLQHDVVGDVDRRRKRAHAAASQALRHPERALRRRVDAPDHAADVTRAARGRVEHDWQHVIDKGFYRRHGLGRTRLEVARDRDLAGDPGDAQAVAAVRSDPHLDDRVVEPERLDQIRTGRRIRLKIEDSVGLSPEPHLAGGAQHPLRGLAPDPALADLRAVGKSCPDPREGRAHAGAHVGRPAHDAVHLLTAVVHGADRQLVGTGVR